MERSIRLSPKSVLRQRSHDLASRVVASVEAAPKPPKLDQSKSFIDRTFDSFKVFRAFSNCVSYCALRKLITPVMPYYR